MESSKRKKKGFSRRKFLVRSSIGIGVMIGATYLTKSIWRRSIAGAVDTAEAKYLGSTNEPTIWFEVKADNTVIFHSPKVEMGQGTFTGLTQIAADELNVDIDQIKIVHADTSTGNIDHFGTGGSTSISSLWQPLRELSATMRVMLIQEAAKQLNVPVDQLTADKGVISGGNKTINYGDVVANVTKWSVPDTPTLKDFKDYKFIGKPIPRVDLMDKVIGTPIFGFDAMLPDMLFGAVVRPDQVDVQYIDADTSVAEKMPGVVKIIKEIDFVGVVARSFTEALNAQRRIKANWKQNKTWTYEEIISKIKLGEGKPVEIQKKGRAKRILNNEENIISQEYNSAMGAHAQIEPNGALADVDENRATIYMSTQVIKITRKEIADRLGLSEDQVIIKPTYLGGGFGRRLHTPNAIQAAVMSKAVGQPVKCYFTRQEEFQNDTFRPPTNHRLRAKLTVDGQIHAIEHQISSGDVMFGSALVPSIIGPIIGADVGAWRGGMIQYHAIPNYRAVSKRVKLPFATSWWRSLGLLANTFAIESFMDQLAESAGVDPVEFRLQHIQNDERGERLRKVIEKAASSSNYQNDVINGRAMGFAASTDANTPCAQVVEVSIEDSEIKVHKVTCVIDPGLAVNPDQIRAQCEGSIIMGMSAALFEKMTIEDNSLQPVIYGPYKMALMKHSPKDINIIILENADAPGAVGEPPLGPIAAAIANAVYRLTAQRLTDLPLQLT